MARPPAAARPHSCLCVTHRDSCLCVTHRDSCLCVPHRDSCLCVSQTENVIGFSLHPFLAPIDPPSNHFKKFKLQNKQGPWGALKALGGPLGVGPGVLGPPRALGPMGRLRAQGPMGPNSGEHERNI